MEKDKELYWYCFVFRGGSGVVVSHASTYVGFESNDVLFSKKIIETQKKESGICGDLNSVVLMNIIPLGKMTKKEFTEI